MTMKNYTDNRERILDIIRALDRPGTDAVIAYLERSNYFKRGCYSHHTEHGGLAAHSLEVYDHMLSRFGGEFGEGVVTLPFEPVLTIVDYNEKMADAIVDYNFTINSTGTKNASEANVKVNVQNFTDTTLMRVEDNYVAPDPLKTANPNIAELSGEHYWRIACVPSTSISGTVRFTIRVSENGIDYDLFNGHSINELLLLYRPDPSADWEIIHCEKTTSSASALYLTTDEFRNGEYAIAIGTDPTSMPEREKKTGMLVYPNPASNSLTIELPDSYNAKLCTGKLYDVKGILVRSFVVSANRYEINTSDFPAGNYILKVDDGTQSLSTTVSIMNNR